MSDHSANLNLPFIMPSQAQKHVTHNEALQQLDAIVQLSVVQVNALTPPVTPEPGDCYALGNGPTGEWSGQDNNIAYRADNGWVFITPQDGWRCWDLSSNSMLYFYAGAWNTQTLSELGVNATPDATNRLSVSSDAVLLSHAGSNHQLKINKASESDTGSLLFQSSWTGHAEMGLAGNNDWSIKVSADGTNWTNALTIDKTTGLATGSAVQASSTDVTPGRLMRADYGYGPGNLVGTVTETGGVPTGAVLESGSNADGHFTRWADGTQMCWATLEDLDLDISIATGAAFRSNIYTRSFPNSFVTDPIVILSGTRTLGSEWDVWAVLQDVTTTTLKYLHMSMTSDPLQNRALSYIAMGRWY